MNQELVLDSQTQSGRDLVWWLYLAHAACLVLSLGVLSWLPLIVNYLKRDEVGGTFLYTHHRWQIRSFWWSVGWAVLGGVLFATVILIPLAFALWSVLSLWMLYRIVKGWLYLNDGKPMYPGQAF